MEKKCLNCSTVMKVKPSHMERKKYCSKNCKYEYQRNNKTINQHLSKKKKVDCTNCGKEMLRKKCDVDKYDNLYCSQECLIADRQKNKQTTVKKTIELKCLECEKTFYVETRRRNAKYCGMSCLGKANGRRAKTQLSKREKVKCNHCESEFEKKRTTIRETNFCNVKCMAKYYSDNKLFSGENSPTWNGGKKTYYGPNWRPQRRKVRERDQYKCQKCGVTEKEYKKELSVHHIVPFVLFEEAEEANEMGNLISVCEPCHRKIHSGKNHPSKFIKSIG